ncbi:hypothetical protein SDRG_00928 [Saprolegnia diclina VS20]|uniref:YkgJ family cysteine cluster protein n=1 Tax=Saprolegnia diclina (strain VS20) TaxID=1156394 RepID=T0SGN3_SAPDV|nr:hypothetical protein SDRG_00928 [Saprolegnia diclina VS20]EQC42087.1 hypothetical protein SDRG_00928 [Saprolegnia diclina VS20]|eukprot:XP_008604656.1 hypothetical protein SDRG_00928 [Saprolegnia diclina VS20]
MQGLGRRHLSSTAAPWFKDGLAFSCTKCGNCCSGPSGSVRFNDDEAATMAAKVGETLPAFLDKYARRQGRGNLSFYQLKEVRKNKDDGFDCIFLDRKKIRGKAVCSLYDARPTQCRTWPFWPETLESRATWEKTKDSCPGINKGTKQSTDDVSAKVAATIAWRRSLQYKAPLKRANRAAPAVAVDSNVTSE